MEKGPEVIRSAALNATKTLPRRKNGPRRTGGGHGQPAAADFTTGFLVCRLLPGPVIAAGGVAALRQCGFFRPRAGPTEKILGATPVMFSVRVPI